MYFLLQPWEVGTNIILILQRRKERPREVKELTWGQTGSKGQIWDSSPGLPDPKQQLFLLPCISHA